MLAKNLQSTLAGQSFGNPYAWDLAYAYYDPPEGSRWNLSTANYTRSFSTASQDATPTGLFFKPDGTKMYICGNTNDRVYEYSLSTDWDILTASYVQNFSVASQDTGLLGLFFKPDGTKMYVIGNGNDRVYEYSLSTAWDVSTASYVQNFSVATQEAAPQGLFFKSDGTRMYVIGTISRYVNEYSLSTAWDISTASYVQNFSVASQDTSPTDLFFKSDGTRMYVIGSTNDRVYEYSLSTAWDVSTASYVQDFIIASQEPLPQGLFFKSDGTKMYVIGSTNDSVYEYSLGSFSVSAQHANPSGLFFKPDGTRMYIIGYSSDRVSEYSLSNAWDTSTASYVQNFSVSAQETTPQGLFFKPDGTKMYVIGSGGDDVNEYSLSTAWDVSTASYVQNFSVAAQESAPTDLFFKPDGTKMYITGQTGDDVNEYSLSTAWDISTASYVQNFSIVSQETFPQGLFFKPDGTKMYITGETGDDVNEYSLSTAWDVSTASYVQLFSVTSEQVNPRGLFFSSDGTKFFTINLISDQVNTYSIGVQ